MYLICAELKLIRPAEVDGYNFDWIHFVLVAGISPPGPLFLAAAQHAVHLTSTASPAGGGPAGGWPHVPFSRCAWPAPWTKAWPLDAFTQAPRVEPW